MATAFQRRIRKAASAYGKPRNRTTAYRTKLPKASNAVVKVPVNRNFPAYMDTTLKYFDQITIDAGVGLASNYFYRANSLFDPDFTGVGHQPTGFDEYSNIYDRYKVLKSKMTIYVSSLTSNATFCQVVGVRTASTSTGFTSLRALTTQPNSNFRVTTGSPNVSLLKCYWNINSIANMSDDDGYTADVGSNPTSTEFFNIYVHGIDTTIDPAAVKIQVMIEYTCRFYDPKSLTIS